MEMGTSEEISVPRYFNKLSSTLCSMLRGLL